LIDLRAARADPEGFRRAVARKGAAEAFDELLEADARWRELVPQVDDLRGRQKLKGKPTPEQVEELKQVKEGLRRLEDELAKAAAQRDELLQKVPNPPHESVPDEMTDDAEGEISRQVGEPREIPGAKEHLELGRFEMDRAARVSGSRFGYIVGDTARLGFALYRWALDRAIAQGFVPVIPPVLVREEAMYGTGFFPAERFEIYEVADEGLYLTGTSEVALAGLHMGEILEREELPLRYTAFSTNFRREAGAAGRDTRGMFRVHQFNKVEMFSYALPEESWEEHERLLAIEESLAQELGLP
jgi:seryl-tRNA synthetase